MWRQTRRNIRSFKLPPGFSVNLGSLAAQLCPVRSLGSEPINRAAEALAAATEHGFLYNLLLAPEGDNVLAISGTSGGQDSYSGTLAFATSVVSEPGPGC